MLIEGARRVHAKRFKVAPPRSPAVALQGQAANNSSPRFGAGTPGRDYRAGVRDEISTLAGTMN
jgi:hypothetical protein